MQPRIFSFIFICVSLFAVSFIPANEWKSSLVIPSTTALNSLLVIRPATATNSSLAIRPATALNSSLVIRPATATMVLNSLLVIRPTTALLTTIIPEVASRIPKHVSHIPDHESRLNRNAPRADNPYYIIVDKSEYELKVYDEEGWYATYPIVFGSKDLGDKLKEGDKRTPNGSFKIILKKIHPKWGPELLLDYPNPENIQLFKQRKAQGIIPPNAKIGNGIAIHATRPSEEWTVDNFYNWTDGCVSVKYTEMKDLFSYIPVGTPVTIQP